MAHPLAQYDVIEKAKSGRSSCRACRKKIDAGAARYGLAIESYDEEIAHLWFHLACGAKDAKGRFEVVYEKYKDQIPELAELYTPGAGGKPASSAYPYLERAPSGRSKCMTCNEAIAKDEERLAVERTFESFGATHTGPGFMHLKCADPKLVAEARAKGESVKPTQPAKPVAAKPKPPPPKDFELAIIANPDDAAGYLVWGDALQSENDPLGALIAAAAAEKKSLFTAALKKQQKAVLGEAAVKALKDGVLELEWRHGVVHTLKIVVEDRGREADPTSRLATLMTDVLSRKALRFVRTFSVAVERRFWEADDDLQRLGWALDPLAKAALPLLRTIFLGSEAEPCAIGGVAHVFAACPRVEHFTLFGDAVSWAALEAPALSKLELHGDLTLDVVKALSTLPKLQTLTLEVVRSHVEPRPFAEALKIGFPALREFTLKDYVQLDAFTELLAASPLLPRLAALTLDGRNLGAKGVAALTAKAPAFKTTKVKLLHGKASKSALDALAKALA